jgi:nicotinic acid mononucleotide adenylyltransferase
VRLARLVVVPRNSTGFDTDAPSAQKVLKELGLPGFVPSPADGGTGLSPEAPVLIRAASLPISGSDLRRRARAGRSLAFRMPESVVAYIREHHLYGGDA